LSTVGAAEKVVSISEIPRLEQHQVRELHRLLSKKTLENEILRDALALAQPKRGSSHYFWCTDAPPRRLSMSRRVC